MKKEEWRKELSQEYSIYSILLWIPGVWPLLPNNYFTTFRFYFAVFLLLSTIITLGAEIIQSCADTKEITDQLVFCAVTINSTAKIILLRVFRKKFSTSYRNAEQNWPNAEDNDFLAITKSYKKLCRKIHFLEAAVHYTFLAMYITAPKLSDQKILPLSTSCLSKKLSTNTGYQIFYFLQIVQIVYVFNGNLGANFFFFAIIMRICGQVEILRMKLSKIAREDFHHERKNRGNFLEISDSSKEIRVDEKECSLRINFLIKRHVKLINLVNEVQGTLSFMLLLHLSNNVAVMSILGLQSLLFLQEDDVLSAGKTISRFFIVSVGLFLFCYTGDKLQYQFEKVSEAAYNCHWYNLPPKISRNVINIQMRARHLMNLNAGRLCELNLDLFKTAMQTAMSFFSLMRIIVKKDDHLI